VQNNAKRAKEVGDAPLGAPPVRVQVGIDAAVTANHHVCVRSLDSAGHEHTERFLVAPTLSGLALLTRRLASYPGAVAVAEPTSMTWLSLSVAVSEAGGELALLGSRHSARLRGAIVGKNKSDVIDADVLARAGDVFTLRPMPVMTPPQLALRRAVTRRGAAVIDGNRYWRRLMSLARWAFPDVWTAFGGSLPTAVAVLGRWPHLAHLGAARRASLTAVVAGHTRAVPDVPARVDQIRAAATAWARFWDGRLDLDALAWDVSEHLSDYHAALERVARATTQANAYWEQLFGDDGLLHSVPGIGPATGPTIRAFLGDGSMFDTGKQAACWPPRSPTSSTCRCRPPGASTSAS